ncbi:hypothetical protein ACHAWF_015277 [Thalassiosira exigua]
MCGGDDGRLDPFRRGTTPSASPAEVSLRPSSVEAQRDLGVAPPGGSGPVAAGGLRSRRLDREDPTGTEEDAGREKGEGGFRSPTMARRERTYGSRCRREGVGGRPSHSGADFASLEERAGSRRGDCPDDAAVPSLRRGALRLHLGPCALRDLFLRYLSYRNPADDKDVADSRRGSSRPRFGRCPASSSGCTSGPSRRPREERRWVWSGSAGRPLPRGGLLDRVPRGIFVVDRGGAGEARGVVRDGRLRGCARGVDRPADDDDDEETDAARNGSEAGAIASSSNEQFTHRPPGPRKRRRHGPLGAGSPSLLLLLEVLTSRRSAHASHLGTVAGAAIGAAYPSRPSFLPSPPPPPPPARDGWRDDDDSADTSVGGGPGGRHVFDTPPIRRSMPLGTRAALRRRGAGRGAPSTATINEGSATPDKGARPFSATRAVARVVGALLAILLTLIPASLIATGRGLSYETTRVSVLGCRPMRILYQEDDANGGEAFECAGGCIPLSREATARRRELRRKSKSLT